MEAVAAFLFALIVGETSFASLALAFF